MKSCLLTSSLRMFMLLPPVISNSYFALHFKSKKSYFGVLGIDKLLSKDYDYSITIDCEGTTYYYQQMTNSMFNFLPALLLFEKGKTGKEAHARHKFIYDSKYLIVLNFKYDKTPEVQLNYYITKDKKTVEQFARSVVFTLDPNVHYYDIETMECVTPSVPTPFPTEKVLRKNLEIKLLSQVRIFVLFRKTFFNRDDKEVEIENTLYFKRGPYAFATYKAIEKDRFEFIEIKIGFKKDIDNPKGKYIPF